MDKAGRGGARYTIKDDEALVSLWARLTATLGGPRKALNRTAEVLGMDYHTAYCQSHGRGYPRWRQQMRPETARCLVAGIGGAVRRARRRGGIDQAEQLREELFALYRDAVAYGRFVRADRNALPAMPPVVAAPKYLKFPALPPVAPPDPRPLRWKPPPPKPEWWIVDPVFLPALCEELRPYATAQVGTKSAALVGRLTARQVEQYRAAALAEANTAEEVVDPDPRTRARTLALWRAMLRDM